MVIDELIGELDRDNNRVKPGGTDQGFVYKNPAAFNAKSDEICYIPELAFEDLEADEEGYYSLDDARYEGAGYTYQDILEICQDNERIAQSVFDFIDWQSPETAFDEGIREGEWEEYGIKESVDMNNVGEDLQVGKWRVHLVEPGEGYGVDNNVIYSPEEASKYGMNLPMVEFYDTSQDPLRFPGGQFVSRYYASTLLGLVRWGDDIRVSSKNGIGLDLMGYEPSWKVSSEELGKVGAWLEKACDKADEKEAKGVSLADRAAGAKEMSAEMTQDVPIRNKEMDAR